MASAQNCENVDMFLAQAETLTEGPPSQKMSAEIAKLRKWLYKHQDEVLPDGHKEKLLKVLQTYFKYASEHEVAKDDEALRQDVLELLGDMLALPEGKLVRGMATKGKLIKWCDALRTGAESGPGADEDMEDQQAAEKYDGELEKQVTAWIVEITGESFESTGADTFAQFLNDGTVLCHLVNKIMPGKIAKVNTMKAPFKKMENIAKFTDAARAAGVPEPAMFATPDLYEEKNLGSVVNCLYTFARVIQTAAPDFQGPKFGIGMAADQVHDAGRGKQLATLTGGLAGTLHDEKKVDP